MCIRDRYEVSVDARRLAGAKLSLLDVFAALQNNNSNTGGSYIEKGPNIYFIRGEGLVTSLKDMENIVVSSRGGSPVRIRDVAEVRFGHAVRYGCLLYTSPSPRDRTRSRMPSSA